MPILPAVINLADLDGTNGFRLDGIDRSDSSGTSVSSAGDVNGDGFDDVIIGASGGDSNGNGAAGESYVVFGAAGGFASSLSLGALDGTNGFRIDGVDATDLSGTSVSGAGDVNGDGIDDIIIGAQRADPNGNNGAGESYVVFGTAGGFAPSLSLATLDGSNGFRIDGIDAGDESGSRVSAAGDVNGDGFDDVIIGARSADPNGNSFAGESYVVFGAAGGFAPSLSLAALDGTNGFRLDGIDADDRSGNSVSSAGDVNGDGYDDLIIGAFDADPNGNSRAGESYVVFGAAGGFTPSLSLGALDGTNGFRIDGVDATDLSGTSVSGAGDVNGDGIDDIIIGAQRADPNGNNGAGESYVVFGTAGGFAPSLSLATLDGSNGFRIDGIDAGDESGSRVSAAGDVNGDGFDDVIIGARSADPNGNSRAGESYVVFGGPSIVVLNGTSGDDTLNGGADDDIINGLDGNDILNGLAGDDTIDGGTGNDVINGGMGDDTLNGGAGNDNLRGEAGNDTLNGGGNNDIIDGGLDDDIIDGGGGADTLRGSGGNDMITGGAGADAISAGIGVDTVSGGTGNDTILGQGGADTLSGGGGMDTLFGGSGNDTLFGGLDDDMLFGQGNNDVLFGEGGDDTLSGAAGSDQLFGGAGNDTLLGSIGADRLDGGSGNDVLNGGNMDGARDTFVFAVGYDQDRINSFDQAGTDRLELDEDLWAGAGTLTAQQVVDMFGSLNASGTILTLDFGNGDILEVQSGAGIDADTLGADILII